MFIELAHRIGDTMGIPYQDAVRRAEGTNRARSAWRDRQWPVLVLGIPSRYVHSHYKFLRSEGYGCGSGYGSRSDPQSGSGNDLTDPAERFGVTGCNLSAG